MQPFAFGPSVYLSINAVIDWRRCAIAAYVASAGYSMTYNKRQTPKKLIAYFREFPTYNKPFFKLYRNFRILNLFCTCNLFRYW